MPVAKKTSCAVRAQRILDRLVEDLCDRRGLRQEWEATDPATRTQIRRTWKRIILREIRSR